MVLCKLALHLASATGRPEVAATVLRAVSQQALRLMEWIAVSGSEACKQAFVRVLEAFTALSSDALLLDIFAGMGMADLQEILAFARKVNAFVMQLDLEGQEEGVGFEQQMRRHVTLLLGLLGSKVEEAETGAETARPVVEECAKMELCGTADFDTVFKTLAERLVVV